MHRSCLSFICLGVVAACGPEAPPEAPALPTFTGDLVLVDDGAMDPGFSSFRDSLRAIVVRRDTTALLAVVAEGARLSYDDAPAGPDGFRQSWFAETRPDTVWTVLARLLDGGSVDEDGAVTIPSVAALWPEDLDPATHVSVPGLEVPALAAPGGATLAHVTETALPITGAPSRGWQPVRLPDGRQAVIHADEVLSPLGHRAVFWDDGDGWRLRSFLSDES